MFWEIFAIVLGVLFFVIFVSLLLPLHMHIKTDKNGELLFYLRLLCFKFGKKSNSQKKASGVFNSKKAPEAKKDKEESITEKVKTFVDLLTTLLRQIFSLFSHCYVDRLKLNIVSASSDAAKTAIDFGVINGVVYTLVGYISASSKIKEKDIDINISCDYTAKSYNIECDIALSVRVFRVITALFPVAKKIIKK